MAIKQATKPILYHCCKKNLQQNATRVIQVTLLKSWYETNLPIWMLRHRAPISVRKTLTIDRISVNIITDVLSIE